MNDIAPLLLTQQKNLKELNSIISKADISKNDPRLIEAIYAIHTTAIQMKLWLVGDNRVSEYDPIN